MGKRILIIDGHPDNRAERYIHALAAAYCEGARVAGHEVRKVGVGVLDFPLLRRPEDFQFDAPVPEAVRACQESISWAEHVVLLFPLWHGTLPALLKGFLEQVLRPGFAFADAAQGRGLPRKLLRNRSARVIVTMGMPAVIFRWYFGAHGLKSLQRGVLEFCGIKPVRATLIGAIGSMSAQRRASWLDRIRKLGRTGL
jgi:putative NADPH-quinone reductase